MAGRGAPNKLGQAATSAGQDEPVQAVQAATSAQQDKPLWPSDVKTHYGVISKELFMAWAEQNHWSHETAHREWRDMFHRADGEAWHDGHGEPWRDFLQIEMRFVLRR